MNVERLLADIQGRESYAGQIIHVRERPARAATFADRELPLHPEVAALLAAQGIERLYSHQAEAIAAVLDGDHVCTVSGTASGKTLTYLLPIVDALYRNPGDRALLIYPTKALAQDQLRKLGDYGAGERFLAETYDGDTPRDRRRQVKRNAQVVLTNPDMLHVGILPYHHTWSDFFRNLRYVVLDEVHSYRGIFGSHTANIMRRLRRVCAHYGSSPCFVCCSATIANPVEHASRITAKAMELVDDDGSPRGPKRFVLWNPPTLTPDPFPTRSQASAGRGEQDAVAEVVHPSPGDAQRLIGRGAGGEGAGGERRGPIGEAIDLLTNLVREEIQTIAFVRTRLAAELISRGARDNLAHVSPRFADKIQAYRGGYLPEERREIERRLASGDILGVASTNALELGIDIGSLDACLMVGYPGTIASAWQQAGRAGRGADEALVFLIADNAPIDQYLMQHEEYLFQKNPEQAVIDPNNPHVAIGHVKSALYELPLPDDEVGLFGEYAEALLEILEEQKLVRHLGGKWFWANEEYPAAKVNLRNIAGPVYNILDATSDNRVIGTMDEVSAFSQLHKHAVYLHDAQSYLVTDLDIDNATAYVERRDLDYYTQAVTSSRLQIQDTEEERAWHEGALGLGSVTVTTTIPMFKKVKYHSRDSLGFEHLEMPPQILETVSLWLAPPDACLDEVRKHKLVPAEGLIGIVNCMVEVAPMFVMCDVQDIGVVVDASNLGRDALFLYDRYPGGMGYAERCADAMDKLVQAVHEVISNCPCADGCPSCVGAALPAFALTDIDSGTRGRIPDKQAALVITHDLLGLEAYVPKARPGTVGVEETVEEKTVAEQAPESPKPLDMRRRLSEIERKRKQE